jgi:hypothetical protein
VYTGSGTNSITVSDSATGVLKMEGIWNGRTAAGMYNDGTDTVFAISPDGVHVFLSFEINSPSNKNYDIVVYYTK